MIEENGSVFLFQHLYLAKILFHTSNIVLNAEITNAISVTSIVLKLMDRLWFSVKPPYWYS